MAAVLLTTEGCGHVEINDFQMCADKGVEGAVCDNFLTSNQIHLHKESWDVIREGMFCLSPHDVGNIKREIEQLCSVTKCTYEQKQKLADFFNRVRILSAHE